MNKKTFTILALLAAGAGLADGAATAVPRDLVPDSRMSAVCANREPGIFGDYWWANRFMNKHCLIEALKGKTVDLVMVGDSITHFWEWKHPKSWAEFTKGRTVLNLGYGGDQTQHVMWRIEHGELDGYKANVVTLMIGTNNNTFKDTDPANVAAAIEKIVGMIREHQPEATVVLHAILPRGDSPESKKHAGPRAKNDRTNMLLKEFAERDGKVVLIDLGAEFLDETGWVPRSLMADQIHPTDAGYEIWAKALAPLLGPAPCAPATDRSAGPEKGVALEKGGWNPAVRERLDEVIEGNRGNPDAYAVFDFDYTTAIGDLTYTCIWRVLDTFDIRTDDFKTLFCEGLPDEFQDEAAALATLAEAIAAGNPKDDPRRHEFVKGWWALYRRIFRAFGEGKAVEWRMRLFGGRTRPELRALAKDAIEDALVVGGLKRDDDVKTERRGLVFAPEIKDLFRKLQDAGISVYIVSGANRDFLRVATGQEFGLGVPSDHAFGAGDTGRYVFGTGDAVGVEIGDKPEFIRQHIAPRHGGSDPVLTAGDSPGDYSMLTEFKGLQAALLFQRKWRDDRMWELAASGRVLLQCRDEAAGVYVPTNAPLRAVGK